MYVFQEYRISFMLQRSKDETNTQDLGGGGRGFECMSTQFYRLINLFFFCVFLESISYSRDVSK